MVAALIDLAERTGTRLALIGGLARDIWAPPRVTLDVDAIVEASRFETLLARAGEVGLVAHDEENRGLRAAFLARLRLPERRTGSVRIDLLEAAHPYYERILDRSVVAEFGGRSIRVAVAEDIILLKLLADRPKDRQDIRDILEARGSDLDRALLDREAAELELELPTELRHG